MLIWYGNSLFDTILYKYTHLIELDVEIKSNGDKTGCVYKTGCW